MCGQPLARCAIYLYAEGARCWGSQVHRYAALGINAKGGACGLLVREVGNAINAQQVKQATVGINLTIAIQVIRIRERGVGPTTGGTQHIHHIGGRQVRASL